MTLRLMTFGPAWGLPTAGPFGLKLEACLRMLGVEYERVAEDNVRKGPKRKSPWIEDDGVRIGDTELILAHLRKTRGVELDAGLDDLTRARAHTLRRTLEEHYHQIFEYELFLTEPGMEFVRSMASDMAWPLRRVVPSIMRKTMHKHLFERGIARHDPADIERFGRDDVDAAVALLGDKPWFFGDEPTRADASAFGLFAVAIRSGLPTPICTWTREQPSLVAFVDRALAHFFPELD